MAASVSRARETGAQTVAALRRALVTRSAELIRSDPGAAAAALEVGLVDARWLEDPVGHPNVISPATEVVERFLQRTVDQRPSRLAAMGLGAVQLLSTLSGSDSGQTVPTTVVFTDLEGFTAYTDRHGDQAAIDLIGEHHRLAGPATRRWGGRIVKHLGDGLLCTFPDPGSGVRAMVELLDTAPGPLRLRAGGHHGEALVSRSDVMGQAVNLAARVTELADGGQVLVTRELADAAGAVPGLCLGTPVAHRLKGISEPVQVVEVTPCR
jgi:class 3 adenylate cyclase